VHDRSESQQSDQPVVLVVDDQDIIRQVIRATLEALGCFVLTAGDGEQALELSRSFRGAIHVLVSDIAMPKRDGLVLREQILRERPAMKVLAKVLGWSDADGREPLQKAASAERFALEEYASLLDTFTKLVRQHCNPKA
jgi:CheY-like chemotaxis protein